MINPLKIMALMQNEKEVIYELKVFREKAIRIIDAELNIGRDRTEQVINKITELTVTTLKEKEIL